MHNLISDIQYTGSSIRHLDVLIDSAKFKSNAPTEVIQILKDTSLSSIEKRVRLYKYLLEKIKLYKSLISKKDRLPTDDLTTIVFLIEELYASNTDETTHYLNAVLREVRSLFT